MKIHKNSYKEITYKSKISGKYGTNICIDIEYNRVFCNYYISTSIHRINSTNNTGINNTQGYSLFDLLDIWLYTFIAISIN